MRQPLVLLVLACLASCAGSSGATKPSNETTSFMKTIPEGSPTDRIRVSSSRDGAGVPLRDILSVLESLAPLKLAESWDNVGLLIGDVDATIHSVLVTVDCTREVLDEAIRRGADLIVSYHPVLFKAVRSLRADSIEFEAIRRNIAIYSPHTALDVVEGGTNDWLARALQLDQIKPLQPRTDTASTPVADAVAPAPLGMGRVGQLRQPVPCQDVIRAVGHALGTDHLLVAGSCNRSVQRIAVGAGSGRSLLDEAIRQKVDVFVTGELPHHEALRAKEAGMVAVCVLHSRSERPALATFITNLKKRITQIDIQRSEVDADPFAFITVP